MDRTQRKPAFIAANEELLAQEAERQGGSTTSTTTGGTTTTTTAAPMPGSTTQPTTTSTTTGGTTTTTTNNSSNQPTTTSTTSAGTTTTTTQSAQAISDELLLNRMRELTGNPNMTMDEMLAAHTRRELSPEEKQKQDQLNKIRVQTAFVNSGKGTIDDYHRLNQLANIKDADLVKENFAREAKELDPTIKQEEIDDAFNEHYFISEQAGTYSEAQVKIGLKRMERDAKAIREQETRPLNEIERDLQLQDQAVEDARQWEKRATDFAATLPRTFSVPIGKIGEKDMEDFTYKISDEEYGEIVDSLKDPAYLLKQIRDEKTGKTDLKKLSALVVSSKVLQSAIRASASEHYSKGVDSVSSLLDNRPDLRNTGDSREMTDDQKQRLEGEAQIKKDAANTFGRGPRTKSIR